MPRLSTDKELFLPQLCGSALRASDLDSASSARESGKSHGKGHKDQEG